MPENRKPNLPNVIDDADDSLLDEITSNFDFDTDAFADIRAEGSTDIKFVANDPWSDKEKQFRRENDRPLIACDLLNQYTNLVINEIRQHPREVKVSPAGFGATAQLAEMRENRIRAIQYKNDAQAAYLTAAENMLQRSYGYFRVGLRYVSEKSFHQEITISRIPNPDAVLYDTGCKELDCSDAKHCFVLDQITKKQFKRDYPDAEIVDFSGELARNYPQWIKDKYIQIAEYWRVEEQKDTLVQFDGGKAGPLTDTLKNLRGKIDKGENLLIIPAVDGSPEIRTKIIDLRTTYIPTIMQYITNGVEILEENEWLGKWIPIVPMFGKELYIDEAGSAKRMLISLIRNARDAQMAYNYFKTCETEAVGMVPKTTYLAIEGQFEGHEQEVAEANKIPKPYIYYKAMMPDVNQGGLLPAPIREPFDPPIQNLEIGSESFSRAIQSAIGMYNSSVGKQDTNVKSGKAIQELDSQSDLGSFHFIDTCNRAISHGGRIINDLISKVEVNERQVPIRKADGTETMVRINTAEPYTDDATGEQHHYPMELGEYDTTISVGPTNDSQRDEATDFLETFMANFMPLLADEPAKRDALAALSIKLRQLGPIGEQMADVLQPPPGDPASAQAQLQQLQAQIQQLTQENAKLHMEKAGKVIENQGKLQISQIQGQHRLDAETMKLIIQLIQYELAGQSKATAQQAQADTDRAMADLGFHHEMQQQGATQAHEHAMEGVKHSNAKELGAQQAQHAQQQQATQIEAEAQQEARQDKESDQ